MTSRPFYTRQYALAPFREMVRECSHGTYSGDDMARLFKAVNAACEKLYPAGEDRGGWVSPFMFGGVSLEHIPPHIMFAVYAIYSDIARGEVEPVKYLSAPLNESGTTAIQMDPSPIFTVMDNSRRSAPMTDILLLVPSSAPRQWVLDTYGTPALRDDIIPVGWHSAATSRFTAMASGMLLLHPGSGDILNPLMLTGASTEEKFFTEPLLESRYKRHCARFAETMGVLPDVLVRNYISAKLVLGAYIGKYGPAGVRSTMSRQA